MLILQEEISESIVSALREKLGLTELLSPVVQALQPKMEAGEAEAIKGFIAFRRWHWREAENYFRKERKYLILMLGFIWF